MGGQKGTQRRARCSRRESEQRPDKVIIEKEKRENYISVGIIRAKESRQIEDAYNVTEQNYSTTGQILSEQMASQRELLITKKGGVSVGEREAAGSQGNWVGVLAPSPPHSLPSGAHLLACPGQSFRSRHQGHRPEWRSVTFWQHGPFKNLVKFINLPRKDFMCAYTRFFIPSPEGHV